MLEDASDELGGEKAGDARISVTSNKCAFETAGATYPMVALWSSGDACASGSRKS
jgi:hypothetical protein